MLTRNVTSTKAIPHEPGQQMTFRQLGWLQLAEAEEMRSATVLRNLRAIGGELMREIQSANRTEVDQNAAVQQAADPLVKYDQRTILRYGIAGWSYSTKPTIEEIDSLDETTARWAATEIVTMGLPPVEQEQEQRFFGSQGGSMATPATATVALSTMLDHQPNGSSA